jgi:hypothetical protein
MALEEFMHVDASGFKPKDYQPFLQQETLKHLVVGFGNGDKNEVLKTMQAYSGTSSDSPERFVFR